MEWYAITNIGEIDTPALVLYKERIRENIQKAVELVKNPAQLRPHVKTNKIAEVCRMMMEAGITRFKCATIAEAEMLGIIGAKDVLLAYQPVGPKAVRFFELNNKYPSVRFSCIVDDVQAVHHLSKIFSEAGKVLNVFIDLNTGMNRTGITPEKASALLDVLLGLTGIYVEGVHVYDGHLTNPDISIRKMQADLAFTSISKFMEYFRTKMGREALVIAGGSATFPVHRNTGVECSPGTFVFWDHGYSQMFPDEPFEIAALVITRIISIVSDKKITADLGYKSVSSENPLPRVRFLNAPDAIPVSQSEEHLSIEVPDSSRYAVGDVLYGVPVHICPTVALYEKAHIVEKNSVTDSWKVIARDRDISI